MYKAYLLDAQDEVVPVDGAEYVWIPSNDLFAAIDETIADFKAMATLNRQIYGVRLIHNTTGEVAFYATCKG